MFLLTFLHIALQVSRNPTEGMGSMPSGSMNAYGLLSAYTYRLKCPPVLASVVTGSTLRNLPAMGS